MNLPIEWVKDLRDPDDIKKREELIRGSALTFSVLEKILKRKLSQLEAYHLRASTYNNSNWAYKQADFVGYSRALNEILDLMELDKNNEHTDQRSIYS